MDKCIIYMYEIVKEYLFLEDRGLSEGIFKLNIKAFPFAKLFCC